MVLVAPEPSAAILPPRQYALDLPPTTVPSQGPPILRGRLLPVGSVGGNHLDPPGRQHRVQGITAVGLIPDQPRGAVGGNGWSEGVWGKGDFMSRSSRRVDGERKTRAVCHRHARRTLAPLGRSHPRAPLLATTQVAAMTHVLRSNAPRSRKSSARRSSIPRSVPSRTHCGKRRWQVW
jgi:hypothetical protein